MGDTRSPLRWVGGVAWYLASALIPPFAAFLVEREVWSDNSPWSLFYPAVFLSAWSGESYAGVIATMVSAALGWFFIIHPADAMNDPSQIASAVLFIAIGLAVSMLRERVRRANNAVAQAFEVSNRINEHLKRALAERRVFAALVENSPDFIGIASPEGRPTYINPAGRRLVGLGSDVKLDATHISDFHPADLRFFVNTVVLPALIESDHWEGESQFRDWQTDRAIPVWLTAFAVREPGTNTVLGIGTITRDMSALSHARDELQAAYSRWRDATLKLAEAQRVAHVGSWSYDVRADTVEWSDELFRIFGRDPKGPVPRMHGPEPIYTSESLHALERAVARIRRDGKPYELDLELIRPDKTTRLVAARGAATRNEAGDVVRITGTAQDVTELRRLQKLREEWMSVIAHDLRQPIGIISMSAGLLTELHHGTIDDAERDTITRIGKAARGLSRMVSDMLDASRIEAHRLSLDRTWVDPADLIDSSLSNLEPLVAEVQIRVAKDYDLPRVYIDPGRIEQVLGNLLSNAIKYGDNPRGVDVSVRRVHDDVHVSVMNRGKGIQPDELRDLFNRFERSRRARASKTEGLGLGLYIAKGLIEAHGGQLWCESVPDEQTTFVFTLPTHAVGRPAAAAS